MNYYNSYKKFKRNLIYKYKKELSRNNQVQNQVQDQELDKFISINDFLATEMSKGPKEEPGNINYFYQSYANIYNFFTILVNHYNFNQILCIPNFVLKFKNYIDTTSIVYFTDSKELIVPIKLKYKINKCMDVNNNSRFIYCTFMIDNIKNTGPNHANMIIIDLYKKTLERFEPYGYIEKFENEINNVISNRLLKIIELNNFTYLSPFDISIKLGPQSKADAYGGMCVTFSMLYLQLRLMNPDTIQKELIEYLIKKDKQVLKKMILRYAKFIEITLKKYNYQIHENDIYVQKKWKSIQKYIISNENEDKFESY